jgi:hypothetical protein
VRRSPTVVAGGDTVLPSTPRRGRYRVRASEVAAGDGDAHTNPAFDGHPLAAITDLTGKRFFVAMTNSPGYRQATRSALAALSCALATSSLCTSMV